MLLSRVLELAELALERRQSTAIGLQVLGLERLAVHCQLGFVLGRKLLDQQRQKVHAVVAAAEHGRVGVRGHHQHLHRVVLIGAIAKRGVGPADGAAKEAEPVPEPGEALFPAAAGVGHQHRHRLGRGQEELVRRVVLKLPGEIPQLPPVEPVWVHLDPLGLHVRQRKQERVGVGVRGRERLGGGGVCHPP